jgi:hypothetical protein
MSYADRDAASTTRYALRLDDDVHPMVVGDGATVDEARADAADWLHDYPGQTVDDLVVVEYDTATHEVAWSDAGFASVCRR